MYNIKFWPTSVRTQKRLKFSLCLL